jgi:hypothetical protein
VDVVAIVSFITALSIATAIAILIAIARWWVLWQRYREERELLRKVEKVKGRNHHE